MKYDEISSLLKEQIKNYEKKIKSVSIGRVIAVGDGICLIYGLDDVKLDELLLFENNIFGIALNLESDSVGAIIIGDDSKINEGSIVKRTNKIVETGVGDDYLGRVVNGFGKEIDGRGIIRPKKHMKIEKIAPGIMERSSVNEPLETGILLIDAMIPIGKGQRELIIGDRETGKTTIALDTILNQKNKNVYCIYVAIGQKNSSVFSFVKKLGENGALEYTTIVSATASEPPALQYLAPYTATTIGEYWMSKGKDVLIIYDDLSKHAVAYRTLSLLLRRPPGREAYPGDVFYLHSRLLERSLKFSKEFGGGSMTALPIIETQANDISAYIPTNVISITDGQIFLETDLFNSGQKPAVNSGLSVSRVGGTAQIKIMKQAGSSLRLQIAQYNELKTFSQFGSDLDRETQKTLDIGAKITEILKQQQYKPIDQISQIFILLVIKYKFIDFIPLDKILIFKNAIIMKFNEKNNYYKLLKKAKNLNSDVLTKVLNAIKELCISFIKTNYDIKDEIYKNIQLLDNFNFLGDN